MKKDKEKGLTSKEKVRPNEENLNGARLAHLIKKYSLKMLKGITFH